MPKINITEKLTYPEPVEKIYSGEKVLESSEKIEIAGCQVDVEYMWVGGDVYNLVVRYLSTVIYDRFFKPGQFKPGKTPVFLWDGSHGLFPCIKNGRWIYT